MSHQHVSQDRRRGRERLGSSAIAGNQAVDLVTVPPNEFLRIRERDRNATTRGAFNAYAFHRTQQMALINDHRGDRIAIIGAGNCNDVDLPVVAQAFSEIHLFDIDGEALNYAANRQPREVKDACHLHERDLTGVATLLNDWFNNAPEPMAAQVAAWQRLSPLIAEAGQFDTVISTCMLSQVAINLRDLFGVSPALNSALCAAIVGHVVLAAALTKPGGTLLIVSDCITSKFPIFDETKKHGPLKAIVNLASQGAAFPGTDPGLIAGVLAGADMVDTEIKDAWIWELTAEQTYLVYGLQSIRRIL